MGIEIELYPERPNRHSRPLRGSYEHGDPLAVVLSRLGPKEGRLGRIDPCRDTALNEQDAGAALAELPRLEALADSPGQREAVRDLGRMLADCSATPGSWLLFVGD
ncbi:hypothetical protein HUT16_04760 [Kitasatospora sp. NA04385]|uniref:hypothetical protein n=1 Tax=Kitasatospora sp. NA04385 TaxID=2742135 RepID=UPI0015915FA9|nr:hypothetical protein [Kitasatospora sp. NA04385]QKW18468.1 hypothetical protein HUT16_04760 [Kitasatospora sp. NA04385]